MCTLVKLLDASFVIGSRRFVDRARSLCVIRRKFLGRVVGGSGGEGGGAAKSARADFGETL